VTNSLFIVEDLLVCPVCKGKLDFSPGIILCDSCNLRFHQSSDSYFDLLPYELLEDEVEQWKHRQQEMEKWYEDLVARPIQANELFLSDYAPYAPLLSKLSGIILDLGGGVGIVRHYLLRDVQYIVIDPSLSWLGQEWTRLADRFPCLATSPPFVRGIGEYLPFPAHTFDGVLAFWTMNHVNDPELVFREVCRVLRPGGRFLVVLEDMVPTWRDIINPWFLARSFLEADGVLHINYRRLLSERTWPLQNDHIYIRESDMRIWASKCFEVNQRVWIKQYLTFEFRKLG
jgi:SAM-dependent methyltransferase